MKYAFIALLALSGCATSAAGLADSKVDTTVTSPKSAQAFATCVAEALVGNNQLRNDGDHYWVLRLNTFGVPISRWDFRNTQNGSTAELRATINVNSGDEKVRACA